MKSLTDYAELGLKKFRNITIITAHAPTKIKKQP